uniref:Uncharacterized protein n=1 Tax=Trichuris muris TaxID=70415 RepID=A0A5S6QSL9_TRIMR
MTSIKDLTSVSSSLEISVRQESDVNFLGIFTAIRDEEEAIRFLQEKGILHRERYCSCGKPMTLAASTTGRSSRWRCHGATCRTEVALRKGTWFEGTHCL